MVQLLVWRIYEKGIMGLWRELNEANEELVKGDSGSIKVDELVRLIVKTDDNSWKTDDFTSDATFVGCRRIDL